MESTSPLYLLLRCALAVVVAVLLWLPPWWAAGRLPAACATPFFRLLVGAGGALVGWLGVVNLVGRQLESSLPAAWIWLGLNAAAGAWLLWRHRDELSPRGLAATWRSWVPVLLLAIAVGAPQWLMAVSTPYWDEVASSAIHLTAPNQFAEGVFPPRHNAFPDLPLKYHYGATILAGTLIWLTGLSANVSVDVVSTSLHLFVFLFVFCWLQQIGFRRLACLWGSFTVLLGGGLAWLYVPWLETYNAFPKRGDPSLLLHRYGPERGWWGNLLEGADTAVFHLRNLDGSNSNLPWDIINQFQQHAVALGVALTVFAAWLFCAWIRRDRFSPWVLAASTFTFGLLFLGHAVFGTVTCVTAGFLLVGRWLHRPSRVRFLEGVAFTAGVTALAFAHGGVLSRGDGYGADLTTLTLRDGFGYSEGGLLGFVNWNLAGFGLPLLLALWALGRWARYDPVATHPRRLVFAFFAVMLLVSYLPPQVLYYSYGGRSVEEHTEVAKFFFVTHLALGVLSAFAIALATRPLPWWLAPPAFAAMAIVPLFYVHAAAFTAQHEWKGFYESPFPLPGFADAVKMGRALRQLKRSSHDVYFDTAWDEEYRHGFLDELQIHGGSVFTLTPRRFERTGSFLIDRALVADRARMSSRMARLRPGAEADSGTTWFYARPEVDLPRLPVIVRSRFDKLVAEGTFVEAARAGLLVLYRIAGSTAKVDDGIERWWRPRAVVQARTGRGGAGRDELAFYDRRRQEIVIGTKRVALLPGLTDDFVLVQAGRFGGDGRLDFAAARMADTHYWRGLSVSDMVDYRGWHWSFHDSTTGTWSAEARRWFWDLDVPLLADLDGHGVQDQIAWRRTTGEWFRGDQRIPGPAAPAGANAVPVLGRFLAGAPLTLAVFEVRSGNWTLVPAGGDPSKDRVTFQFGRPGDILVPGDYDGDGVDEVVVWRRSDTTWYRRDPATGTITSWIFGSPTGIPLPADYDRDGRLDVAYWEPAAREIRVSFTHGRSVDRTIPVPPDAVPIFVSMY
jgi:hypothetical protein